MNENEFIFDTGDGVVAVDRDQRIVLWNGGAEELLGFKPEGVLGHYCYEVFGGRDESGRIVCQAACQDMLRTRRREPVRTYDMLVRTKVGEEKWISVSTIRVPSRRSDLCVLVHLFRDVSHHKDLERFVEQIRSDMTKFSLLRGDGSAAASPVFQPAEAMTSREQDVLHLLATGASTEAIAAKLGISPVTARNHINNLLAKLGVHSRLEAVTIALKNGVI
jgi:PAS domain S-box-containing protein